MKDRDHAEEIRALVNTYGLHSGLTLFGKRCCTMEELDEAIAKEVADRVERNSTSMVVTTGEHASPPGVFLPAP